MSLSHLTKLTVIPSHHVTLNSYSHFPSCLENVLLRFSFFLNQHPNKLHTIHQILASLSCLFLASIPLTVLSVMSLCSDVSFNLVWFLKNISHILLNFVSSRYICSCCPAVSLLRTSDLCCFSKLWLCSLNFFSSFWNNWLVFICLWSLFHGLVCSLYFFFLVILSGAGSHF